jgi:tetratricopeptide (TPR) repeat protein
VSTEQGDSSHARQRSALLHRETIQLGVLLLAAAGAFVLTRTVAADNRAVTLRDAAEWYRRGRAHMETGDIGRAIDAFRRAAARDRNEKRYVLALAGALTSQGDLEPARSALMTLREAAPDDPDVNLLLARLAAKRLDVTEALRFYRNALYSPWPNEQAGARRQIRIELIRFLLERGQQRRALSESIALATDIPDEPAWHLDVGRLFAAAGDHRNALDQFQRALRLEDDNAGGLAGAGQAAFALGDYALARTYLRRVSDRRAGVQATLELVELVLSNDPLAARLGSTERRRRLAGGLDHARARLDECFAHDHVAPSVDDGQALQREVQAYLDRIPQQRVLDQDTVEAGVDLINRVERAVLDRCGPGSPLDQALLRIGRQHTGGAQ